MPLSQKQFFNYDYLNYEVSHRGMKAEQFGMGPSPILVLLPIRIVPKIIFISIDLLF